MEGTTTVSEKWRRCAKCRGIKPVEDFDGDEQTCRACLAAPVRTPSTRAGSVTTRRVSVDTGPDGAARPAAGGTGPNGTRAATVTDGAGPVRAVAARDLRGRGDHEVRTRRARVRALDRLAEEYPEDFARLLADERRLEGLG